MKVRELIEHLEEMDQDLIVYTYESDDYGWQPIDKHCVESRYGRVEIG